MLRTRATQGKQDSADIANDTVISQTISDTFQAARGITSAAYSDMVLLMDHVEGNHNNQHDSVAELQAQFSSKTEMLAFQPVFVRIFSGSLHIAILVVLFLSWVCKRIKVGSNRISEQGAVKARFSYYKQAMVCSWGLSLFNLLLCVLNCFYWYSYGWSGINMVTLLDSLLRTLAWFGTSLYLHNHFPFTRNLKFPIWLGVWWGFFFVFSCYFLVIDSIFNKKTEFQPILFLVGDAVSTVTGLFLCFVGIFSKKVGVDTLPNSGNRNLSPRSNATVFSILSFSWMSPLIGLGYEKTLNLDDLPQLSDVDSAKGAYPVFQNTLHSGSDDGSGITAIGLLKALLFTTWREVLLSGILAFINTFALYVGPYLIDTFVQYLNGRRQFSNEGLALVFAFLAAKIVECLARRHWLFLLQQAGIRARAIFVATIYRKGLSISWQSKQGRTSGEIINLVAIDADKLGNFVWYIHDPWVVIVQVLLALVILYKNLGVASIAAHVATVIVVLVNLALGIFQKKSQDGLMKSKDERMKVTSEVLRNMKILKLQAWEMKFLSKIVGLRDFEARWLKKYLNTYATTLIIIWIAPTFVSVVTFGTCVISGIQLESGKILSALAVFKLLRLPIFNLPDIISMFVQTKVSLNRIASFLSLEDLHPDVVKKLDSGSENAIEIINGNFSWDFSSCKPTLTDINLKVLQGTSVAVCGTVGSGKSSLLSCILGEMPKISGNVKLRGTKVYLSQFPWIQSGKIEENVLFGKAMDREKYEMVLEACALKKDLEVLPFGDQIVIGERGINLSGGQKQRVQIARALYQDADVYLFDDPFSAVDAHTGSHLFKKCIQSLLASKTVVYVTHQVEFLPAADLILVMKDGRIYEAGKYSSLLNSGSNFKELVCSHEEALAELDCRMTDSSQPTSRTLITIEEETTQNQRDAVDDTAAPNGQQIVQDEEREKGQVGLLVYWKFATTAYKGALVPFIISVAILLQLLQIGSNYWLAWATPVSKDIVPRVRSSILMLVYACFAIGGSICVFIRSLVLNIAGYKTATILFTRMHLCIFRAPMSFFDSTPSGRILNRASTDQSAVDLEVPNQLGGLAFNFIEHLGIIGVMSQVTWQVLIVFVPVIVTCIWLQQRYIRSGRELARLAGTSKAPVLQHFAETISGVTTIRSFGQEPRFVETTMELIDGFSRPSFYSAGAMEWLCFRMDVLSGITLAFFLAFLTFAPKGKINPSIAGLALTYGLTLNDLQSRIIWRLCNVENKMISVERLLQHTTVKSEPPLVIETSRPDSHWPAQGEIVIQDLQVRYASHMPLVLRGLTCTFRGGMRTGIVGRTGSGKSTLIQTLFRVVDPAAGRILIDDVDITLVGLHDLRSRLSIIPQDPTMFQGSVRSNLDPLEEYTDKQIWEALDKCQLGDEVRKKEGKLESSVTENGENWSMGQRQLVCLGRVLLKKSKVLVLDEATASVDTASDNVIQQTLKRHFSGCTVLTIAHRITSVVDSDMVLLLDHGLIEEYDSPTKLLENRSSSFAKLEGIWDDVDVYHMSQTLYEFDACCSEDLNWETLIKHRLGDVCWRCWNQMYNHIGKYGCKSFTDQVEVHLKIYCPDVQEAWEIWANKPVVS